MSMTTAPVTVGGSTLCTTREPAAWMMMPQMKRVRPTHNRAPETSLGLPPEA